MGEMPRNWEEELLARGIARGEARGIARGEAQGRLACCKALRLLLDQRFAPLPEALIQRLEAANLAALAAALDRAATIQNLDDLGL